MKKTVEIQPDEKGPMEYPSGLTGYCYACQKQHLNPGDQVYRGTWQRKKYRGVDCLTSIRQKKEEKNEDYWRRLGRKAEGSDKRRRAGGHGYSGGDGFTDL